MTGVDFGKGHRESEGEKHDNRQREDGTSLENKGGKNVASEDMKTLRKGRAFERLHTLDSGKKKEITCGKSRN